MVDRRRGRGLLVNTSTQALRQALSQLLPDPSRLKEVYINVTWKTHGGQGSTTIIIVGLIMAMIVAVAFCIAYAVRH